MKNALVALFLLAVAASAGAQGPRISALYPAGAQAGQSVTVAVRGGNLVGIKGIQVAGAPGVTAQVVGGAGDVDEKARPLFQAKCTTCHEARSPANRSLSPEQWAQTVDRMINARGADIAAPDRAQIVAYLQALSRAGQITARFTVAPDALPGLREVRLVSDRGVSTAWSFEVGASPEIEAVAGNQADGAQAVTLPVVVNGTLTQAGQRNYLRFAARKGQRLCFNLKAFRLNEQSATFFSPVLYLYDTSGHELAKNLGRIGTDPILDWTPPADGDYLLLVRDLLWHGSPASVYRVALSDLPTDGVLLPGTARPGANVSARLVAFDEGGGQSGPFAVRVPAGADGVTMVSTPGGEAPLLVRDLPDGGGPLAGGGVSVALPALFRGEITAPAQVDVFRVHVRRGGPLEVYARRLGSPLQAQVTVKNNRGNVVASRGAEGEADLRVPNAFPGPGDYTVEVSAADSVAGPGYSYYWEALDGAPDFQLTVTPDLANVSPGTTTAFIVRAARRDNVRGPIRVSIKGLPPGVTATEATLLPDMNEAVLTLTAGPNATVATGSVVVEGRTASDATTPAITRRARPLEIFRVNNNPHITPRLEAAVAVSADPPLFTLALRDPAQATVAVRGGGEIKLGVHVNRQAGYKGEMLLQVMGLPPGVNAPNVALPAGQSDATVTLRVAGDSRFVKGSGDKSPAPLTPVKIVVAGFAGGGANFDGVPAATTPAITLVPMP